MPAIKHSTIPSGGLIHLLFDCIQLHSRYKEMKPAGKGGKSITSSAKVPEKKIWRAEDYQGIKLNVVEEFREIKTAFDCFDSNLSGVIDPQELGRVFLELGFKGHYNFLYLGEYEGGINLVEFVQLVTSQLGDKSSRSEVSKVWRSFDINRAGKITTHELKRVAKELGEELADEEIEKIFAKADLDDDGFVTGDDFYNIITHKVYWKQLWT